MPNLTSLSEANHNFGLLSDTNMEKITYKNNEEVAFFSIARPQRHLLVVTLVTVFLASLLLLEGTVNGKAQQLIGNILRMPQSKIKLTLYCLNSSLRSFSGHSL